MAAPAYAKIQAGFAGAPFYLQLDPGATAGQPGVPLPQFNFPNSPPGLDMTVGTTIGLLNIAGIKAGSAAGAIVDVDLTAINDPFGTPVNFANVLYLIVLNDSVTAGSFLTLGAAAANPWVAPFNGSATGKLTLPPGGTLPNGKAFPGQLWLGTPQPGQLLVSGTSKVLRIDPGALTIPYRLIALGIST